mmetsp:Transcript_17710/g.24989  ORF Transcript_17710/g.24989 Transcript_17710/m.24989 type:complete len:617 (+) Transcript_17710:130-1980(+)
MSLLGFTRDSVVDLLALAENNEDDDISFNTGSEGSNLSEDEDILFLEDDVCNDHTSLAIQETSTAQYEEDKILIENEDTFKENSYEKPFGNESKISVAEHEQQVSEGQDSYSAFYQNYSSYDFSGYDDPYDLYKQLDAIPAREKSQNIFCCFFPSISNESSPTDSEVEDTIPNDQQAMFNGKAVISTLDSNPVERQTQLADISTNEEKESMRSHEQSRLSPNPVNDEVKTDNDNENNAGANDKSSPRVKPLKGILKMSDGDGLKRSLSLNTASSTGSADGNGMRRRTLFPKYEARSTKRNHNSNKEKKSVVFSSMARVIHVDARSDISLLERTRIWWQRSDFDDFKKTGRIISKAMAEGGSKIWLSTTDNWGSAPFNKSTTGNHSPEYKSALNKYGVSNIQEESKDEEFGSKWWCKFGHSRRGLEHVVSTEEGRQRQRNVKSAIQALLDEQRRQRLTRHRDQKKLAAISLQYTSWARELALASGKADEEAVRSNFNIKAKSRISFLQDSQHRGADFVVRANPGAMSEILDANTTTTLLLKEEKQNLTNTQSRNVATKKAVYTHNKINNVNKQVDLADRTEAIDDLLASKRSISQQAAGFGADHTTVRSIPSGVAFG